MVRFYIQLKDAQQVNVSESVDGLLSVACVTTPPARGNATFCLEEPWLTPMGSGLYMASLTVGTIWYGSEQKD